MAEMDERKGGEGMKNEDAIRHIECVAKNAIKGGYDSAFCSAKALILVAELLKTEPCEDAVSREFMYKLGAKCIAARNENGELVAITSIESLPPVTMRPRTGKWEMKYFPPLSPKGAGHEMPFCSCCGAHPAGDEDFELTPFCPYCGVKMEGESE